MRSQGTDNRIRFTWNSAKARANRWKHGIAFEEALTVFTDPLARIHDDPEHSEGERREIIVGHSDAGRLLLVSFTERDRAVRLISARKATRGEHEDYEEAKRP
jgi:uncharacterized DUF497 family protein